jgi:hypothetical protein
MVSPTQGRRKKKLFTLVEANATLPLVRAIVRDITELARDLRERNERLNRVQQTPRATLGDAYQEEMHQIQDELGRDQERMQELETELESLGVELKDYYSGLIDFPSLREGREVYLCWRFGEPEVAYWHELDAGFAGRQKIMEGAAQR